MNFELPQDILDLQDAARDFAERELAPRAAKADEEETFVAEQVKLCAEAGWLGMSVPEAYGGSGLGAVANSVVVAELSRACASTGVTVSVHTGLACYALVRFASEEQKKRYLPRLASGEWLGAYSLSEAGSGSDAGSLRCAATPDGAGGFILEGSKLWISSGDHADVFVLFARTGADLKSRGITAFLVEAAWKGVRPGKKEKKLGIRGSSTVELHLDRVHVPKENVMGQVNEGFTYALSILDGGRIGIASQAIGIAEACLAASVKYAQERQQFGRHIAEFESIQWKLAEMALRIDASKLLTYRAASLRDANRPHTTEASMAKLEASRCANYCAKEAVQIHGGAGYTREFPVERYFRDARVTEIYEGTTEIQTLVIARHLLRA